MISRKKLTAFLLACLMILGAIAPIGVVFAQDINELLEPVINRIEVKDKDGKTINLNDDITEDIDSVLEIDRDAARYESNIKEGDYFNVNIPDGFKPYKDNFDVYTDDGIKIGNAHIVSSNLNDGGGILSVVFESLAEDKVDIKGSISILGVLLQNTKISNDDDSIIEKDKESIENKDEKDETSDNEKNFLNALDATSEDLNGLKFSISNNQASMKTDYYSNEILSRNINIDGTGITTGNSLENGYVDITVPSIYFNSINALNSPSIRSQEVITNSDGTTTLRVYLSIEIDPVTKISFPINMTVKKRVTPQGYEVLPIVTLNDTENEIVATAIPEVSTTLRIKYDNPIAYKTIGDGHYLDNGKYEYAGELDPGNPAFLTDDVSRLEDINFTYLTNTVKDRDFASFEPDINKIRQMSSIIITDILPTYKDKTGQTKTAYFDPNSNPGWTLSSDGKTVAYTVSSTASQVNADILLRDNVKLKLKFPGAPVSLGTVRNLIQNDVTLTPKYINQTENEISPNITDNIQFYLSGDLFYNAGIFTKISNTRQTFFYDEGKPSASTDVYNIRMRNNLNYPIKNVIITEGDFDSRMYASRIIQSNIIPSQVKEINGILGDGSKEKIAFNSSAAQLVIPLDSQTTATIEGYVGRVENGTLSDSQVPNVPARYKKIEIVMKDDFVLIPGKDLYMLIEMKLTDPYHTIISGDKTKDTLRNNSSAEGDVILSNNNIKHFNANASDVGVLVKKKESIVFSKRTRLNTTGALGENFLFTLGISTNGLSQNRTLKNLVAFDLLPIGVDYISATPENVSNPNALIKQISAIPNYKNTGRTAVIIYFYDFKASQFSEPWINIRTTINEKATTSAIQGAAEANKNTAFLFETDNSNFVNLASESNIANDTWNVDNNSSTTRLISANSTFMAKLPEELTSYKYIKKFEENETNGTRGIIAPIHEDDERLKTGIDTNFEQYFEYQLKTYNNTSKAAERLFVFDRLDFYEGTNKRNELVGPIRIEGDLDQKFKVHYTTDELESNDPNTQFSEINRIDNPTDYGDVTAFYIELTDGSVIDPYTSVAFDVPVRTPKFDKDLSRKTAINTSYISYNSTSQFGNANSVYNTLPGYISVSKIWKDKDSNEINAPEEMIEVELYKNDEATGEKLELNEDNYRTGNFIISDLDNDYSIKEIGEENGEISIGDNKYGVSYSGDMADGFIITNTAKSPDTPPNPDETYRDIKVSKEWKDEDGNDIKAPIDNIVVELYQDGEPTDKTLELNYDNNWSGIFEDLEISENSDSNDYYQYSIKEIGEENGEISIGDNEYNVSYNGNMADGFIISNSKKAPDNPPNPDETYRDIKVSKKWKDETGTEIKAPVQNIEVELYKDGNPTYKTLELNEDNNRSGIFEDLEISEDSNSSDNYQYSIKEIGEENGKIVIEDNEYNVVYDGDMENGFIITNTQKSSQTPPSEPSTINIKVKKDWIIDAKKIPVDKITVELYKDGKETGKYLDLNDDNNWNGEFKDLDIKENEDSSNNYHYTVKEVGEETGLIKLLGIWYNVIYEGNMITGFVIKNEEIKTTPIPPTPTENETINIKVKKDWIWYGIKKPIDKITVELYKDGKATGKYLILNKDNNWTSEFKNLDLRENSDSNDYYQYSIKEIGENGNTIKLDERWFDVYYKGNIVDGFTIINKQEIPDNSEEPEKPETPDKPGTPGKPQNPEKPNKPETPGKPSSPEKPGEANKPGTPSKPDTTKTPSNGKDLPKTGNGLNPSTYAWILLALGILSVIIGIQIRKRRENVK